MMVSKRNLLFQGLLFRFHVKFQGCILQDHLLRVFFFSLRAGLKVQVRVPAEWVARLRWPIFIEELHEDTVRG